MSVELRPYQARGLDLARAQFKAGKRRVLLVAPTGAGKTILFSAICKGHVAKGGRVLVVVHRRELIRQSIAKMKAAGIERIGVIAPGWALDRDASVQIASVQTLIARETLPFATLVVLDEAHHYVAAEWGSIAEHYESAKIVGVTATPERGDGTPLGDLFEVIVPIASVKELVALGFLVPCDVVAPARRVKVNSECPLVAYEKHASGRQAVVFAASVAGAYALAEKFTSAGYPAACVEGDTRSEERDQVLARFARGELRVLSNVYCLTEGWDCPSVEVCILARGCSAVGTFLQIVGRALRPSPETGKTRALLIDLRGAVHEHGLPADERTYSLEGKAISGSGAAPVRTCPSCDFVIPLAQRTCPHCGTQLRSNEDGLDVVREELSRVERVVAERAFFIAQLEIARARGFKPGWVIHRYREKFGTDRFPSKLWREFFGPHREVAA